MQSSNFQQFVSSNKGNLITFKHQGAIVSKYVVDVCGEYFTAKGRLTDAKIDGFYYFAECEMYNRSLIETLAYHKYVVLIGEKSPMPDAFFEYQYCKYVNDNSCASHGAPSERLMVMGKQLSVANPDVGYTASYIGEVWAIVEGKYTQVWKKVGGVIRHEEDEKMDKIREKATFGSFERSTTGASGPEEEIKKRKVQWYKDNADDWIDLWEKYEAFKNDKFMFVMGKIKTESYSEELYNELCSSFEGFRNCILSMFKNNHKNLVDQALEKRFLVLTNNFKKIFDNNGVNNKNLIELIDVEISMEEEIKKRKVQWYKDNADEWIDLWKKYESFKSDKFMFVLRKIKTESYSEGLYNELCSSYEGFINCILSMFKNKRKNPRVQALVKRFLVLTNEFRKNFGNKGVHRLIDLINAEISMEGENEYERMFETKNVKYGDIVGTGAFEDKPVYIDIEYRGKAKTVEIMNEYTHKNGKEYVWVKDLTDNGKTKTLFKEYIKYM